MAQIFISYSRKDIGFARKLAGDLEKAGYDVWWDITDLRGGDDWVRSIPDAIQSSDHFIVVLSPEATASEWVRKEYTQALGLRKKIIPILLKPTPVPFALITINYVNFATGDYADNLNNLLAALGYTGEPPVESQKSLLPLPPALRPYAIPIMIAVFVLFAVFSIFLLAPLAPVTSTPSIPPPTIQAVSLTPEPDTPTASATASLTATATLTPTTTLTSTLKPTSTLTLTRTPSSNLLTYCVNSPYVYSINVRSGPGTIYAVLGEPLVVGECLTFSARNEEETWLQIALNQRNPAFQQYEGGWIFRDLLGLGTMGPIDLPAVTLTSTPTPSDTPTVTPTFTRTPTSTLTDTPTPTDTPTVTPTPTYTDTPTPADTPTP